MSIVDDEGTQATAKLVADATKLAIIRGLINRIEKPFLIDEAMGNVGARLRTDGWRYDRPNYCDFSNSLAQATGTSTELVEAIFAEDRLDLVIDELRLFVAANCSRSAKGAR